MDPDLVLTSGEKTVRFRKCLRRVNNGKKTRLSHDTAQNSNISQNVKERIALMINSSSSAKGNLITF